MRHVPWKPLCWITDSGEGLPIYFLDLGGVPRRTAVVTTLILARMMGKV